VVNRCFATHFHRLGQRSISNSLLRLLLVDLSGQNLASLLHIEARLIEPRVLSDLADGRSLGSIVGEQRNNQILELDREVSGVGLVEVEVVLASRQQVVEVLIGASLLERENPLHDDEKDDSEREQVDLGAVVGFSFLNLRGHVGKGTSVALEVVYVLVASKAEVSDLQIQVVVNEDVLKLEVSVGDSVGVHVVHGVEHLVSEEPTSVLSHSAHQLAYIE
jgi:hypothetical protein